MKNLREIRKESGYTQTKIANLLCISQQTYSDYENGKTFPDEMTLIKIADALNVSTDYLLGRADALGGSMSISTRLKELRLEEELTQKELAEKLGITQDSISLWEKGKRMPDTGYIIKLCEIFQISADYLLGLTDDEFGASVAGNAPYYSPEEQKLIQDYRGLSQPLKDVIQTMIKTWQGEELNFAQKKK